MSDRQIALEFLRRLSAKRIDEAAHLMADGLQLVAPSERNAFSVGEPRGEAKTQHSRHEVINVMEDEEGITVLYEYEGAVSGDVPCAVETQRRLGSRLRNHL